MIVKFINIIRSSRFKAIVLSSVLLSYFVFISGLSVHYAHGQGNVGAVAPQEAQDNNSNATTNSSGTNNIIANANSTLANQSLITNGTLTSINSSNSSVLFSGVGYPPQADPGSNQEVKQGQWVTLNGTNSYDPEGGNLSYSWNQVSGKEVALEDDDKVLAHFRAPSVSQDSVLKFTLLVEDENSDIGKNSVYVTVKADNKPHANSGGDQTVNEGDWVTLDGDGSYEPDGGSLDYSWTQTSGESVNLQDSDQSSAHFYAPNVYDDETLKFTLRVEDANGNSDESSASVKVENSVDSNDKPHADAGGDQTVDEGEYVTLDGDNSYDPDGSNLDYSWTQTSGESVDLQNDDESSAHFYAPHVTEDTTLHFNLVVEDDQGRSDEDSVSVQVNGIDDFPDNLPCVQTYDTARGTYVTNCENGGGGTLPIIPPCNPGGLNPPNCQPVPLPPCKPGQQNRPNCNPIPPCKPGQQNNPNCNPTPGPIPGPVPGQLPCNPGGINPPNCKPGPGPAPSPGPVPPCNPGGISPPNCKPTTAPVNPKTEPKKIQNKPVTQNKVPNKPIIQNKAPKVQNKPVTQNTAPKKVQPKKVQIPSKPQYKPPKQPTQKFKPPKTSSGSKFKR